MRVKERQFGTTAVLDVSGPIAGRKAAGAMEEAIRRHAREGTPAVVVNLADVPSVDLVGLGALVDGYRTMRIAGGELTLANLTTRIHALIVITRLLTVFQTFDTVEEAISRSAPMPRAAGGAPSALALDGIQRFLRRA